MKNYNLKINGKDYAVEIKSIDNSHATVAVNGVSYSVGVEGGAAAPAFKAPSAKHTVAAPAPVAAAPAAAPRPAAAGGAGAINSPLPGVVLDVLVNVGDTVTVGQKLMVLEAMKMENNIESDRAGVVQSIPAGKGDSVLEGDVLITIG